MVESLRRRSFSGHLGLGRNDGGGLGFSVFVGVKIDGHANERALGFEKAVVALPEVVACHLVSGEADYFLEVFPPIVARLREMSPLYVKR